MLAQRFANTLTRMGISVLKFEEGDDLQDGAVYVSEKVHIQIPTGGCGRPALVIEHDNGNLEFRPECKNTTALVLEIQQALKSGK